MTVTITQNIRDIAGISDNSVLWFSQPEQVRAGADETTMITTRRVSVRPSGGVLTVELEPGPAQVQIDGRIYPFTVPDADASLWPLIEVGLAPEIAQSRSVVNAGGIARMTAVTQSEYAALTTPDPQTVYFVVPDA